MNHITDQKIQNFCIQSARKLVTVPNVLEKLNANKRYTKIVYPDYKNSNPNTARISEQELRLCFCLTLERVKHELLYSLETPTKEKFSFSTTTKKVLKTRGRSGNIDLSIYSIENNKVERDINVEFKHGNPSPENVLIDLLKLTNEHHSGLYYIVLDNIKNNTLSATTKSGLINKIIAGLTNHYTASQRKGEHLNKQYLVISIVLPNYKYLMMKTISIQDLREKDKKELAKNFKEQLEIKYKISKGNMTILKMNGWRIVEL